MHSRNCCPVALYLGAAQAKCSLLKLKFRELVTNRRSFKLHCTFHVRGSLVLCEFCEAGQIS
jgi:hypothetical protein